MRDNGAANAARALHPFPSLFSLAASTQQSSGSAHAAGRPRHMCMQMRACVAHVAAHTLSLPLCLCSLSHRSDLPHLSSSSASSHAYASLRYGTARARACSLTYSLTHSRRGENAPAHRRPVVGIPHRAAVTSRCSIAPRREPSSWRFRRGVAPLHPSTLQHSYGRPGSLSLP
jgi:hypothetical protein